MNDEVETIERNPKSWAAWKREAERLQGELNAAEAELLAANEKLTGDQVPVFLKQTGIGANFCQGSYKEYVTIEESEYEENPTKHLKLFTALQKPVVLHPANNIANIGDNRHLWHQRDLMWQSAIKAAGGKVEGE